MLWSFWGILLHFFSGGADDSKLFWGAHFFSVREQQKSVTERRLTMEKLAVKERFTKSELYGMEFTSIFAFWSCFCQKK